MSVSMAQYEEADFKEKRGLGRLVSVPPADLAAVELHSSVHPGSVPLHHPSYGHDHEPIASIRSLSLRIPYVL